MANFFEVASGIFITAASYFSLWSFFAVFASHWNLSLNFSELFLTWSPFSYGDWVNSATQRQMSLKVLDVAPDFIERIISRIGWESCRWLPTFAQDLQFFVAGFAGSSAGDPSVVEHSTILCRQIWTQPLIHRGAFMGFPYVLLTWQYLLGLSGEINDCQ